MRLSDLIKDASSLPAIPKVVQELMDDFNNPFVRLTDVSKKIKLDQALSAKVLRMANSARYARSRTFDSVDEAAIIIGLDSVKMLVLSSGVASAFSGGVDMHDLWRRSFMLAEVCRYLANEADQNTQTGFTVGLLHNLGEILIASRKPEMYKHFLKDKADDAKTKKEIRIYGISSIAAGAELASHWRFPANVSKAIAEQEAPTPDAGENAWASLLYLGLHLTEAHEQQSQEPLQSELVVSIADKYKINLTAAYEAMTKCAEDTEAYLSLID